MSVSLVKSLTKRALPSNEGKTDLLLRFFQSPYFDEWIALQYLFQNTQPGVHDYLCNKLYELPESALEKYLLQLVYLAVSRPGQQLERTIVDLCSKYFRTAVKVQWLLLALCQDHPKNKALEAFKEKCYRTALEGRWDVPFSNPSLDPLSPGTSTMLHPVFSPPLSPNTSGMMAYPLSPATKPPSNMVMSPPTTSGPAGPLLAAVQEPSLLESRRSGGLQIDLGCLLPVTGTVEQRAATAASSSSTAQQQHSQAAPIPIPTTPVRPAMGGFAASQPQAIPLPSSASSAAAAAAAHAHAAAALMNNHNHSSGGGASAAAADDAQASRLQRLRQELGDGEGVTALLERSTRQANGAIVSNACVDDDGMLSDDEFSGRPMSPLTRIRYDTFSASLDFIEALCDASSSLVSLPQDERPRALRYALESINRDLDAASRRSVAVWFPMGERNDRVLRLASREAVLLNSREKAPFMLFVEVLEDASEAAKRTEAARSAAANSSASTSGIGRSIFDSLHTLTSPPATSSNAPAPQPLSTTATTAATGISSWPFYSAIRGAVSGAGSVSGAQPPLGTVASDPDPSSDAEGGVPSIHSGRVSLQGTAADESQYNADTPGLSPSWSVSSPPGSVSGNAGPGAKQGVAVAAPGAATAAASSSNTSPIQGSVSAHVPSPRGVVHGAPPGVNLPAFGSSERDSGAGSRSASGSGSGNAGASDAQGGANGTKGVPLPALPQPTGTAPALAMPAPSFVIPTRSTSSTNIAAIAAAAMAAATASNSGVVPSTSTSSFQVQASGGSSSSVHTLAQPQPPHPSAMLPPVASAAAAAAVAPPTSALATMGSLSPISAAREASVAQQQQQQGKESSTTSSLSMGATSLLRRVLGDRSAEDPAKAAASAASAAASTSSAGGAATASTSSSITTSGFNVVRSLCFSSPDLNQAGADATSSGGGSGSGGQHSIASALFGKPPLPTSGVRGMLGGAASQVGLPPVGPSGKHQQRTGNLTNEEMQELVSSGCLSSAVKSDSALTQKMSTLLASLRGEAPLVKLHIRVLPQPPAPRVGATAAGAAAAAATAASQANSSVNIAKESSSSSSVKVLDSDSQQSQQSNGPALESSSLVDKDSTSAKDALSGPLSLSRKAVSDAADSLLDKTRALALLSRFGLCRKPTIEEEAAQTQDSSGPSSSHVGASSSSSAQHAGGSGGIAVSSAAAAVPSAAMLRFQRVLLVTLEVAQGVNLAIPSPYRKSRRTPSCEAIEAIAGKFKVNQIPPPCESGPPLASPLYALQPETIHESEQPQPSPHPHHLQPSIFTKQHHNQQHFSHLGQAPLPQTSPHGVLGAAGAGVAAGGSAGASPSMPGFMQYGNAEVWTNPTGAYSGMAEHNNNSGGGGVDSSSGGAGNAGAVDHPLSNSAFGHYQNHHQHEGSNNNSPAASEMALPHYHQHNQDMAQRQQLDGNASPHAGQERGGTAESLDHNGGGNGTDDDVEEHAKAHNVQGDANAASTSTGGGDDAGESSSATAATAATVQLPPEVLKRKKQASSVYGERWHQKAKRIQRESPHGRREGWALRCVIVKSGDDCRQELMAVQLIRAFAEIFQEAHLPLWVRHYEVLVTSNRTALIEMVPDTLSIHTAKQRHVPHGSSLSDHFFAKFVRGTPECAAAQRRFTESMAAYSIIAYLLQIKDRHNGNILIDDEGHIVHIDFGFMLSNSPGGVNFESAPFKLTRELLEVMDSNSEGKPSELFDYFKVLMIQGFLACRKHNDRLLLLVKMMAKSGFPCFKTGDRALKHLEKRFQLSLTELQTVQHVLSLISDSLDAWRTRQYDYYQRVLNGIL